MIGKGLTVKFSADSCKIIDQKNAVIAEATLVDGMFKLNRVETVGLLDKSNFEEELWHRRLGHVNHGSLIKLKNGFVDGVDFKTKDQKPCEICLKGKQARKVNHVLQKYWSWCILISVVS